MTISNSTITHQLRAILALTNTEIQIAEVRQGQARTDGVRAELAGNAAKARQRTRALERAIRERGGYLDFVRPALGRLTAAVKTVAEQAQPFDEALLGDLALEQRLLGRATYLKALAAGADDAELTGLAETLIAAHTETIEWLNRVLAEEALGGPVALRRSPTQWAGGIVVRTLALPAAAVSLGVDRATDLLRRLPEQFEDARSDLDDAAEGATQDVTGVVERAGRIIGAVGDVAVQSVVSGRDAALSTLESDARARGADAVADAVHSAREAVGGVGDDELPIDDYSGLNVSQAAAAVKRLDTPADIRVILRFEQANKNRQGVVSAAQERISDLASDVVNGAV